jgi:Sulfatase-modifying factor enzyme 1
MTRRWLALACILTSATLAIALVAEKPAAPEERILKLFVDELVPLTPGKGKFPASFEMGSAGEDAPATEKPVVKVTFRRSVARSRSELTPEFGLALAAPAPANRRSFAMSRHEVTQELYQTITGKNPSKWKGVRNSVEEVDWNEANDFCGKLTAELRKRKLIAEDEVIRLPSEAEWEYACRAGTTTKWAFGDKVADLTDYAWYKDNSKGFDPPVGKKKPNAWGLYDMHGYVWEWCADTWSPTHEGASADGTPRQGKDVKERVVRSGSWADSADDSRSAFRAGKPANTRNDRIGFRCVKAAEETSKDKEKDK